MSELSELNEILAVIRDALDDALVPDDAWQCLDQVASLPFFLERVTPTPQVRKVFLTEQFAVKVRKRRGGRGGERDSQRLFREYRMLLASKGIRGVPAPVFYARNSSVEVLIVNRAFGRAVDAASFGFFSLVRLNIETLTILARLSGRGVIHGDVVPHNVFYAPRQGVTLIDFGHAATNNCATALASNLWIRRGTPHRFNRPYTVFLVRSIEISLPDSLKPCFRKVCGLGAYVNRQVRS